MEGGGSRVRADHLAIADLQERGDAFLELLDERSHAEPAHLERADHVGRGIEIHVWEKNTNAREAIDALVTHHGW